MPKAHRLMYSLIYPAVLGTVLINVFIPISNFISGQLIYGTKFTFIKLFLTVGIVFHFAVDYLFAEEAQENGWKGFFIDTLILMGLWIAASSIQMNQKEVPNFAWLSGALAFVYAVFIFYVCKFCKHYQSWERVAIVESLGFLWFIIGAFWMNPAFIILGLFLFGFLLAYTANKVLNSDSQQLAG